VYYACIDRYTCMCLGMRDILKRSTLKE
jgi:hypothetical protein